MFFLIVSGKGITTACQGKPGEMQILQRLKHPVSQVIKLQFLRTQSGYLWVIYPRGLQVKRGMESAERKAVTI